MPAQDHSIVLVVQDRGLRGALVARLTVAGAAVTTMADAIPSMLRRASGVGAILILDDGVVAGQPREWLSTLVETDRWRGIIILAPRGLRDPGLGDRMVVLSETNPVAAIFAQLAHWGKGGAGALMAAETDRPRTQSEVPPTGCGH